MLDMKLKDLEFQLPDLITGDVWPSYVMHLILVLSYAKGDSNFPQLRLSWAVQAFVIVIIDSVFGCYKARFPGLGCRSSFQMVMSEIQVSAPS